MENLKQSLKRLYNILLKPELGILPGQISFFLVLSMIPLITLMGYVASTFSIDIDYFIAVMEGSLPIQIIEIIIPALTKPGLVPGVSMIVGFFLASNATNSLIISSNLLYKIDPGEYFGRRFKAIFMLFVLGALFFIMLVVMAFGNDILIIRFRSIYRAEIPMFLLEIFSITKWVTGIFIIFVLLKILFTLAPNSAIPSRTMNKGAYFTTISWVTITLIYTAYISTVGNYNVFYGSLANIIVLMMWIYFLSYTLVIGIAINSEEYFNSSKKTKRSKK